MSGSLAVVVVLAELSALLLVLFALLLHAAIRASIAMVTKYFFNFYFFVVIENLLQIY